MVINVAVIDPFVFRTKSFDAVEILAAVALHREWMLLAKENTGGIHLMAAEFRHQSAARLVVQSPVDKLLRTVITQFFELA